MTVIVERAVVAVFKISAPSMEDADAAFAGLEEQVRLGVPMLRTRGRGKRTCSIIERRVSVMLYRRTKNGHRFLSPDADGI